VKNITGSPAEGENFFNRPRELNRLGRELANNSNILLTAPRRVGKTSLILRLCEIQKAAGWRTVFVNVEDCTDELCFAEKLLSHLKDCGLNPAFALKAAEAIRRFRKTIGPIKGGGAGIDVELGDVDDADYSTLGKAVESVLRRAEEGAEQVLIAIDELPEFLLALGTNPTNGSERVVRFLHWLRALRQAFRQQVHWVFLGSIGLDSFVEEKNLGKTVNDLSIATLDALTNDEADLFLHQLGIENGVNLSAAARTWVITKIGWPLPHHLQLMFHAIRELEIADLSERQVQNAFETLLRPQNNSSFDTWRQRLKEQFKPSDAKAAFKILDFLCLNPQGRHREAIMDQVMLIPNATIGVVEEQVPHLLKVLVRDGYLIEGNGQFAFRSFLLREFWRNR
jgi:hypothetical protein